ncbi:MAG: CBS domain-containing protein [Candidatus Acidiferrum sp.]
MLVKELMRKEVIFCTPWDAARTAASLMKLHDVGAIPVVWDKTDPLLEGIVTDRDLCCGVVCNAMDSDAVKISDLMTEAPVTCTPEFTVEECEELMQENLVRRVPVVDDRGRCVGIVTQADIARHASAAQVQKTIKEISNPSKQHPKGPAEQKYFYCGQTHEEDQILLLSRRRQMHRKVEVPV